MKTSYTKINKGFTLVELMVATSIFVIIMLASMGSLFTLLDASKSSRALRFAMDNVNFAMESMTRSIRMGTNYICIIGETGIPMTNNPDSTANCPSGGNFIAFIPQPYTGYVAGTRIGYKLSLRADGVTNTINRCEGSTCVPIVSPDVDIKNLKFIVKGSDPVDGLQANVFMIIKGSVMVKGVETSFSIQTLASQRNF